MPENIHQPELIKVQLNKLADQNSVFRKLLRDYGYPDPRVFNPGFETLVHIILGQQVSVKSAAAIKARLLKACCGDISPSSVLKLGEEGLKHAGLSKTKVVYVHHLASLIDQNGFDLQALTTLSDDELIAELTRIRGFGIWSAQIYAMFALGRSDIFPHGDLALRKAYQHIFKLKDCPDHKSLAQDVKIWSPYRSVAALMLWKVYGSATLG